MCTIKEVWSYNQEKHNSALLDIKDRGLSSICDIVSAVTDMYCLLYCNTPSEINEGFCQDFARDVRRLFPDAEVLWEYEAIEKELGKRLEEEIIEEFFWSHCFIFYKDKYYDSECHEGVEHWTNLPFFQLFPQSKQTYVDLLMENAQCCLL